MTSTIGQRIDAKLPPMLPQRKRRGEAERVGVDDARD